MKFLDNQYVEFDGKETKFVDGIFTIFGHGIVVGLGQALDEDPGSLKVYQGRQRAGHGPCGGRIRQTGQPPQNYRLRVLHRTRRCEHGDGGRLRHGKPRAAASLPRRYLRQQTSPTRCCSSWSVRTPLSVTTNDAFRPVCRFWERIIRPEQLMPAMVQAMRVLTDPELTGAVCIALSQDVEGESYDFPDYFLKKRVHKIRRPLPVKEDLDELVALISESRRPMVNTYIYCYSRSGRGAGSLRGKFGIPSAETQAGKSACHLQPSHERWTASA